MTKFEPLHFENNFIQNRERSHTRNIIAVFGVLGFEDSNERKERWFLHKKTPEVKNVARDVHGRCQANSFDEI